MAELGELMDISLALRLETWDQDRRDMFVWDKLNVHSKCISTKTLLDNPNKLA